MKYLWVIEINFSDGKGWFPTTCSCLSRTDARTAIKRWHKNNPCEKFRITKYVREDKNGIPIRKGIPQGRVPAAVGH